LNGIRSHLEYKSEVIIHLKITAIIHTISVWIEIRLIHYALMLSMREK